jgi:hypothetical protein
MSTTSEDFKIKHGLQVAGDANFIGSLSAAEPTESNHAATVGYARNLGLATVDSTAPSTLVPGKLWLDMSNPVEPRLKVYNGSDWTLLATTEDANFIPEHIHDTAIDGTGRIIEIL